MAENVICSRPECQTTAGCHCDSPHNLSRQLYVIRTALTESEATEHKLRDQVARLRARIAKLEEALAFYATPSSWEAQGHSQIDADTAPIRRDKGDRARSALSGGKTDSLGYPLAEQPHPDAYFDPAWRSRHGPKPMDGWRLAIRCKAGCEDGVSSMAAAHTLTSDDRCPICAGPMEMFNRDAEASR